MAYENGVQRNRYSNVLRHKQIQKKRHMKQWPYYNEDFEVFCIAQKEKNEVRPYPIDEIYYKRYWNEFYLSGPRQYAKDLTDQTVRAQKLKLHCLDNLSLKEIEEMDLDQFDMTRQIEIKLVDYAWTVW